jgi:hypothetical protein
MVPVDISIAQKSPPTQAAARAHMTAREKFIAALSFDGSAEAPFMPGHPRESTLKRWHAEGLDTGEHYLDAVRRHLGLDTDSVQPWTDPGVDLRMAPQFEERVLRHEHGHYVVQDWMGNVVEISDQYDVSYLRQAKDFVTRRWISFPVNNRAEWEAMKSRYNPDDLSRFPSDFADRCAALSQRDYPAGLSINGPFWQLREWLGFEPLCMLTLTDPEFVAEMVAFWTEFVDRMLAQALTHCPLDYVFISEDMAYKEHPMISPDVARELLLPSYQQWVTTIKSCGCPLVVMDSDGYIADLIPIWIDAGIDACNPLEVAAGNDIVAFRKRFGRRMAYWGGIDKRAMAAGGTAIEREVARVCSLLPEGGLIPSCDHGVPHDISWPDFLRYCELLAGALRRHR